MRGLIACLYLLAVGWAISHYEIDKLAAEAGRRMLRELMREQAVIALEVAEERYALPPGLAPGPAVKGLGPAAMAAERREAPGPCYGPGCDHISHRQADDNG